MSFENETFDGVGEGDSGEPTKGVARTAFAMLERLSHSPMKQATAAEKYLESLDTRRARILKACSAGALKLLSDTRPDLVK